MNVAAARRQTRSPLLAVDVRGAAERRRVARRVPERRDPRARRGCALVRRVAVALPGAGAIAAAAGLGVAYGTRGDHRLGIREGFLVVSLTWLAAATLGALPFVLSGDPQLDRPIDAYFEGMSGFSTTGGSILTNVEAMPRGLLFWRQLTQWLGGIGIIVLALAVLPRLRVGGRQLLEHEMPGPEIETLNTRIRDTARRVWILYVGLTATLFAILLGARPERRRRGDDPVRRDLPCADDHPDRRLLDARSLGRGLRERHPVGARRLHGARRDQLRAPVPRDRGAECSRRVSRQRVRLYLALLAIGCALLVAGGPDRGRCPAGRAFAPASSPRCPR